jgi:hypothetical protein
MEVNKIYQGHTPEVLKTFPDDSKQKLKLAYIAGIVDGEGYVGITKTKPYKKKTGRVNPVYHEKVQIRMVNEKAIKFIAQTLGGWYWKEKPSCNKGKPLYCYQISDRQAAEIIKKLLPFLKVKKQQAKIILQLRKYRTSKIKREMVPIKMKSRWGKTITVKRGRYSKQTINKMENFYLKCKELNKKGI